MNENANLQKALRRLADLPPRDAGPITRERVLSAFRAQHKRSPRHRIYLAVAAASLALAFAGFASHAWRHSAVVSSIRATNNGFIALPYSQSDVPMEQAVIVRVRLQPPEWGAFGLPPAPPHANAINADLLIAQDGVPRAVRLVSVQ
jgi:hypothetical protein